MIRTDLDFFFSIGTCALTNHVLRPDAYTCQKRNLFTRATELFVRIKYECGLSIGEYIRSIKINVDHKASSYGFCSYARGSFLESSPYIDSSIYNSRSILQHAFRKKGEHGKEDDCKTILMNGKKWSKYQRMEIYGRELETTLYDISGNRPSETRLLSSEYNVCNLQRYIFHV